MRHRLASMLPFRNLDVIKSLHVPSDQARAPLAFLPSLCGFGAVPHARLYAAVERSCGWMVRWPVERRVLSGMAGLLALVARDPLDVPSHAAVPECLLHLRDFQTGHLPPLARVRMPEAVVRPAPVGRILREGAAVVCHVYTSLPWARGSRGLSLHQKEAQKSCHKDLVIKYI